MTPEQAAFCVRDPDHPFAKELVQRDWDEMMKDPQYRAVVVEMVRELVKRIDEELAQKACQWCQTEGETTRNE